MSHTPLVEHFRNQTILRLIQVHGEENCAPQIHRHVHMRQFKWFNIRSLPPSIQTEILRDVFIVGI
jgi:hypothetical protein